MIAQRIVAALLDSDEELMNQLGDVAADPVTAHVKHALETATEFEDRLSDRTGPGNTVLDISIKPIGQGEWAKQKGSRMVQIRWSYQPYLGRAKDGGGYFFVRPENFAPVIKGISDLSRIAVMSLGDDHLLKVCYDAIVRYRYSAPRKKHARQKYTDTGVYAYFR